MKKIIIITGQTATGKTKLALELAQKYNGELINCDSRQVYKKLDIITGKDLTDHEFHFNSKVNNFDIGYYTIARLLDCSIAKKNRNNGTMEQLNNVNLWLYDIVSPNQYFSSFDYKQCALYVIQKILSENKTPIVVGGTYFYLKHLLYGVETENIPPNQELRKELNSKSAHELQKILVKFSPELVEKLSRSEINNPQRLIRKIEILKANRHPRGVRMVIQEPTRLIDNLNVDFLGLRYNNKDDLKKAITGRVEKRLKQAAIDEVKKLIYEGYTENDPGLKTIGYKQIIEYLKGKISKEKAINEWITREVQYARRQYTFMKKDPNIKWKEI